MKWMTVDRAMVIMAVLHRDQVDKGGRPYMLHPLRVEHRLPESVSNNGRIAAILHDVLEDTDITPQELAAIGVPAEALDTLDKLTRRKGETYNEYIRRLLEGSTVLDPEPAIIKLADLEDNLDPSREGASESLFKRYRESRRKVLYRLHQLVPEVYDDPSDAG